MSTLLRSVQVDQGVTYDAYRIDARTVEVKRAGRRVAILTADDRGWGYRVKANNGLSTDRWWRPVDKTDALLRELYGDAVVGRLV